MAVKRLFNSPPQFVDSAGDPYSGARLFFYAAGSSTKQNAYSDSAGSTAVSNPCTLNSSGYPAVSGNIVDLWGTVGETYKIGLAAPGSDDPPSSFIWESDSVAPINDTTVTIDQWISGPTPTYVSSTQFTLVGDQTTTFHVGRKLKVTDAGGTQYCRITASAFTSLTTVTVEGDSLSTPTSAVSYGIVSRTNTSLPAVEDDELIIVDPAAPTKRIRFDAGNVTAGQTRVITAQDLNHTITPLAVMKGHIVGLIQSVAADTEHDTTISVGACVDSTAAYGMILSSAITKRIDAAWAVGTGNGGLDGSESVAGTPDANTWYYIWLIARSDTGVVDALYSESATAPTMPTNYDYKRLIGAVLTDGSANIIGYTAHEVAGGGLEKIWSAARLDVDVSNTLTTSRTLSTLSVPVAFSTKAHIRALWHDASAGFIAIVQCPDETDAAPSQSASPGESQQVASNVVQAAEIHVRTSAAGQIASRATLATVDTYRVVTVGFEWSRR